MPYIREMLIYPGGLEFSGKREDMKNTIKNMDILNTLIGKP
jgi:hypothetical protein